MPALASSHPTILSLTEASVSADLATRDIKLSHVTVRKIIAGRGPGSSGSARQR
jgi:hypothetical protein